MYNILNYLMSFSLLDYGLVFISALFILQSMPGRVFSQAMIRFLIVLFLSWLILLAVGKVFLFRKIACLIFIGVTLGFLINLFLVKKTSVLFRKFAVNTLKKYQDYFSAIMQKKSLEMNLESVWLAWPFWANHNRFDIKLRPGYDFFLQKINQIGDVLFALNYLSSQLKGNNTFLLLEKNLLQCEKDLDQFFSLLIRATDLIDPLVDLPDIKDGLISLENKFREIAPYTIESLDLQPDIVLLASFICSLEDLHWLLHKLAETLQVREVV